MERTPKTVKGVSPAAAPQEMALRPASTSKSDGETHACQTTAGAPGDSPINETQDPLATRITAIEAVIRKPIGGFG